MNALRDARIARGLSLEEVIAITRLSPRYAKAIDEGRLGDLPAGVYARGYVRAFAAAVRAEAAVEALLPLLPTVSETIESIDEVRSHRRPAPRVLEFPVSCLVTAAAVVDACVLLAANALAVAAGALTCGVTARLFVEAEPALLMFVCATMWVEYFVLFAGINGRTAGEALFGLPRRRALTPLRVKTILARTATTPASGPGLVPSEAPACPC